VTHRTLAVELAASLLQNASIFAAVTADIPSTPSSKKGSAAVSSKKGKAKSKAKTKAKGKAKAKSKAKAKGKGRAKKKNDEEDDDEEEKDESSEEEEESSEDEKEEKKDEKSNPSSEEKRSNVNETSNMGEAKKLLDMLLSRVSDKAPTVRAKALTLLADAVQFAAGNDQLKDRMFICDINRLSAS
jgi:flagellar biosynthesis GTPase FlhF